MAFIFQSIGFVLTAFFLWYLPGYVLLPKTTLRLYGVGDNMLRIFLGMILMTIAGYGLGLVGLRLFVLPVLVSIGFLGLYRFIKDRAYAEPLFQLERPHIILLILSLVFAIPVITSGWTTAAGVYLGGVNSLDGIWNVALSRELMQHMPPLHPSIAGVPLRGYHIFYNLLVAEFVRATRLDIIHVHFHFMALTMATLLVFGIYKLALRIGGKPSRALWATFFALFGGSFSYLLPIFYGKMLSLDDALGITQPYSLLVSPSFVFSLICIVYVFILLHAYLQAPRLRLGLLMGFICGAAVGFKVYAGPIVLGVLAVVTGWQLVRNRRLDLIVFFLGSMLLSWLVFMPLNGKYGFLVYLPFWPPHRVMTGPLDFTHWELKRQSLELMGSRFGIWKLEVIAFCIFLFGNLGTRIIGLLGIFPYKKDVSVLVPILIVASVISFIIPLFFIQPIGTFNMIQFFWYFLVFMGILAGLGIGRFLERFSGKAYYIVAISIIVLTIPSAGEKFISFGSGSNLAVSAAELDSYKTLTKYGNYDDTVLEIPQLPTYTYASLDDWFGRSGPPKISAFGNKREYIAAEVVQFPYDEWKKDRLSALASLMRPQSSPEEKGAVQTNIAGLLRKLHQPIRIRYIFAMVKNPWFESESWVKKIYTNSYASIYEVLPL